MRVPAIVAAVLSSVGMGIGPPVTSVGSLPDKGIGIVLGPDGNLWHTTKQSVGFTTPAGASTSTTLSSDADAGSITAGPDGALWFVHHVHAIGRLVPGGDVTVFDNLPAEPHGITAGPDGNVWFAAKDKRKKAGKGAIGRITAQGELTLFGQGISDEPRDIAAGPDGALWFTEPDAKKVGRITTDGTVTETPVTGKPTGLVAGPDGALWFTDPTGSVGRIATDGTVTRYDNAGNKPGDIALGPDGALYYTLDHGIGRITTAGAITSWDVGDAEPVEIAGGPDSAVYFTDKHAKALGRLAITQIPVGIGPDPGATPEPGAPPSPSASASPSPAAAPTPQANETFVVKRKHGKVRVRKPGKHFESLAHADAIPMGSVVDSRRGAVTLSSETADGEQSGTFRGGLFKVRQRAHGHTDLYLRGRLDCAPAAAASIAHKKHKRRHVWGKDDGGAFSTHGRDSVTTVRGTKWLTKDTCRGTITRVVQGEVVVRDRATGDRHVVTAGHRHLTRHQP